jgi:formylglycine-generating enzyme required for sulfatase activity
MTWVSINDPGVSGHEGFTGEMSKYETTNDQYCQFLNAALASNQITVYTDNIVYATSDTNYSQPYFRTEAGSSYSQITYSGGTFSVRSRDGYSMANHPVVMVSWYGATAFCNYYGYRLPTEWEWQAVADYNGTYTYGCGTTISKSKANCWSDGFANPLGLTSYPYTSPVGYYPAYGYGMCDMAGNVDEWTWTSSIQSILRGGSWATYDYGCAVSSRYGDPVFFMEGSSIGFRVCR